MTSLAATYAEARERFLEAADRAGGRSSASLHPLAGREGEELAIDVTVVGPTDSEAALVIVSGTHGVEGYTGSALQTHWLNDHVDLRPQNVSVVLVHGFNPYGFSWVRRVNEDNVDLNRNFVDWDEPAPVNERYGGLATLLVPETWDEPTQQGTTQRLLDEAMQVGLDQFQEIVSGGQYAHPTGIFYGGSERVWSHRWLEESLIALVGDAARIGVVDLHTGLGPWGHGELISHEGGENPGHRRAVAWWGDVRSMLDGESVSAALTGDWLGRLDDLLAGREVTAAALEFGTVDSVSVLQALRADAWLHAHGDPSGDAAAAIRDQVRAAFADDDPAWIETVASRFDEVIGQALAQLGGG
jgi:hypothetical protein